MTDTTTADYTKIQPTQNGKLASALDVYETGTKEFAQGDKVKFRIKDDENDLNNGDTGTIKAASEDQIVVQMDSGQVKTLDPDALRAKGMDHTYALTVHNMQGTTVDSIVLAMGGNEILANQKSFYVGVSRSMALSDICSANSFFSFAFSASSAFSFFASDASIPPHLDLYL